MAPLGSTIPAPHAATAPAAPLPHSGAVVAAEGMAVAIALVTLELDAAPVMSATPSTRCVGAPDEPDGPASTLDCATLPVSASVDAVSVPVAVGLAIGR